jgi:hypothetical protein
LQKILTCHRFINFFRRKATCYLFSLLEEPRLRKSKRLKKKNIAAIVCAAFFQLLVHPFTQLVRKILVYGQLGGILFQKPFKSLNNWLEYSVVLVLTLLH